jgi:hypothetical protein
VADLVTKRQRFGRPRLAKPQRQVMFSEGRKLGLLAKRRPYNLYLMWLKRNYHVFCNIKFGRPLPELDFPGP